MDTQLESWSGPVVTRNLSTSFRVVEEINFIPARFAAHQSQAKLDDNYCQDGREIQYHLYGTVAVAYYIP